MKTKQTRRAEPGSARRDWHTAERRRWLTEVQRNMDRLRRRRIAVQTALTIAYVEGLTHGASATASVEDFHPDELKPGGTTND